MSRKAWFVGTLVVIVLYKTFLKEVFGKNYLLWEAVNATANFELDPTITHMLMKVVFIDKLLRDVTEIDGDILSAFQWSL